jgi:hypothetical protein
MSEIQTRTTQLARGAHRGPTPLAYAAVAGVGAALVVRTLTRRAAPPRRARAGSFEAYLLDHLTGSDAAISVVERLRRSHAGTRDGALFSDLHDQFREERAVVSALLERLGGSTISIKRVSGRVFGGLLEQIAGGGEGDLALFRTLEALAVGVQGKRLLWRALHALTPPLDPPPGRTFRDLEALALDQWHRIEERRLSLAPRTFRPER